MAREKFITETPHVRVSLTLLSAAQMIAEREDRSISWFIREAMEEKVARYMAATLISDDVAGKQFCAAQCAASETDR